MDKYLCDELTGLLAEYGVDEVLKTLAEIARGRETVYRSQFKEGDESFAVEDSIVYWGVLAHFLQSLRGTLNRVTHKRKPR